MRSGSGLQSVDFLDHGECGFCSTDSAKKFGGVEQRRDAVFAKGLTAFGQS
jgi:hypothetical protein